VTEISTSFNTVIAGFEWVGTWSARPSRYLDPRRRAGIRPGTRHMSVLYSAKDGLPCDRASIYNATEYFFRCRL
jgi:hypothetical protein